MKAINKGNSAEFKRKMYNRVVKNEIAYVGWSWVPTDGCVKQNGHT